MPKTINSTLKFTKMSQNCEQQLYNSIRKKELIHYYIYHDLMTIALTTHSHDAFKSIF